MRFALYSILFLASCAFWVPEGHAQPKPALDLAGDPLPEKARARLGTLRMRTNSIYYMFALSGDGKRFIRSDGGGEVVILDAVTGEERRKIKLEHFAGSINGIVLSDDGTRMAWYNATNTSLHLHDLDTGKELLALPNLQGYRSLQLSGDGSAVCMICDAQPPNKPFIDVWDTRSGKQLGHFEPLQNQQIQAVLSGDGKVLASWGAHALPGGGDSKEAQDIRRTVEVWDVATGKQRHSLLTGHQQIGQVAVSHDGARLLAADFAIGISLFTLDSGKLLRQVNTHALSANLLAFAPDGKTYAAGSPTGFVQVYETESGKRLESCQGPGCALTKIVLPPKGKVRAFGFDCQALRTWEVSPDKTPDELTGHTSGTHAVQFLPGGKQIVTSAYDSRIMFWDASTYRLIKQIDRIPPGINGRGGYMPNVPGEFSPDGKYLATFAVSGENAVYETATGTVLFDLPLANMINVRPAMSSIGHFLALPLQKIHPSGTELSLGVWNLETGQEVRRLKMPWPDMNCVALSPDGASMTCVRSYFDPNVGPQTQSLTVISWNVTTGKEQFQFNMTATQAVGVTYSPDGKSLLVTLQDSLLWVADVQTGTPRKVITIGNDTPVGCPAVFAPDGRTFALARGRARLSGGVDSRIQIWEVASKTMRHELPTQDGTINSLTFAPDGKTLASTSSDTTVMLWDIAGMDAKHTGQEKLGTKELAELWEALNKPAADEAFAALVRLERSGNDAVALLRERLQPAGEESLTKEQIAKWIKDLDADDVKTRDEATEKLTEAGTRARPQLTAALEAGPSLEASERIKRLLENLAAPDENKTILRPLRAIEVLERIGTPEAKEVVKRLAGGREDAALTVAAKRALERMR